MRPVEGGAGTNVEKRNTQAKKANLSEGRGAKPQVQNGRLGCRLERDGDQVLFGGESLKSLLFQRTQPGDNRVLERKEGPIDKEDADIEKTIQIIKERR